MRGYSCAQGRVLPVRDMHRAFSSEMTWVGWTGKPELGVDVAPSEHRC